MAEKLTGKYRLCIIDNLELISESHIIPRFIYRRANIFKDSRKVWTHTNQWGENPKD